MIVKKKFEKVKSRIKKYSTKEFLKAVNINIV